MNKEDVLKINVPLFIRLLEYAREDAKTDMDLHKVTENVISLSKSSRSLTMNDYDVIIKGSVKKEGGEAGKSNVIGHRVKTELDDIAWDIGMQNKWIVNGDWLNEKSKQKAYNIAKLELYHFAKGGKAGKGWFDGVDWIITGKA